MEYKFKEVETHETDQGSEPLPIKERPIEKRGHVITFTLQEVEDNDKINRRNLKEITAKRDYEAAKMVNIEEHHPMVKEIPEFDRYTIHMYQEACAMVKACDAKIEEIEKQLNEDTAEIIEIKKQLPELVEADALPAEEKPSDAKETTE